MVSVSHTGEGIECQMHVSAYISCFFTAAGLEALETTSQSDTHEIVQGRMHCTHTLLSL